MTVTKKPNGLRVETFYSTNQAERASLARRLKKARKANHVCLIKAKDGYSHYGVVSRDGNSVAKLEHRPGLCCKKAGVYEVR